MEKAFLPRLLGIVSFALVLASCSDRDQYDIPPPVQAAPTNAFEEVVEGGEVGLEGVTDTSLNSASVTLKFLLKKSVFAIDTKEFRLTINAKPVDAASFKVASGQALVPVTLDDGRNDIVFKAYDSAGRPVFLQKTIWAGSHQLSVAIVDATGAPVTSDADVRLQLSDAPGIVTTMKSSGGVAIFPYVPDRTVIIEAHAASAGAGTAGAVGSDGKVTLQLVAFNAPSTVDNNDFSQGLAGYAYGASPVTLVPHAEQAGPAAATPASALRLAPVARHAVMRKGVAVAAAAAATTANMDASLSTSGEGPQKLSRTFIIKPGTSSVSVRYRFVTSEVPGGYFGSKFNDYFSVTIRSKSGASVSESNAMNGLGLAAFDGAGSTAWKTATLHTDQQGDTVQVDLTVANVADDALDSEIIVDLIAEKDDVAPTLAWDPANGGLKLTWKVGQKALENSVNIDVHWASGPAFGNRMGAAITTVVVPAGTAAGATGTSNIPGRLLQDDPDGQTHLLAVVSEDAVGPVSDVRINYDANADQSAVSDAMRDVIRDGLRNAGTQQARISRTAVSPADQARAMFQNLVASPGPLASNIAYQLSVYAPPGDAVVRVFETQTQGQTVAQAQANSVAVQAAMVSEINAQGPSSVSKHCADPALISVVDVPMSSFGAAARPRFTEIAAARSRLLVENAVYHMEILR